MFIKSLWLIIYFNSGQAQQPPLYPGGVTGPQPSGPGAPGPLRGPPPPYPGPGQTSKVNLFSQLTKIIPNLSHFLYLLIF